MYRIVEVKPLEPYHVWLRFSDGVCGNLNLSELVGKGVFAAWNDPSVFSAVSIDPDTHTLCWPRGIDLAPEVLYEELQHTSVSPHQE